MGINTDNTQLSTDLTESNILSMSERLTKLRINVQIKEEENRKLLNEIAALISSLDEETLKVLTDICPEAEMLRTLTVEDIMSDIDGANKKIHSILSKLFAFLEEQLEYFEGLI